MNENENRTEKTMMKTTLKGTTMMKKSFALSALLLVACSVQANTAPLINGVSVAPYLDEWARTSDLLIQKPREAAQAKRSFMGRTRTIPGVSAAVGFLLGGFATDWDGIPSLAIALCVAGGCYGLATKIKNWSSGKLVLEEERAQLNRVLDVWKEAKPYFPKQLHQAFEDLLKYRQANVPEYNVHLDRTIALVKQAVTVHNWELKKQRPYYN